MEKPASKKRITPVTGHILSVDGGTSAWEDRKGRERWKQSDRWP
jgi:hypothetical protein